ncbi:MAG TPA: hypothetical protein VMO24_09950, partial [Woeseiaceae bacterium]|nr:hypothetical protein [Woeseiaceae bacterium]
MSLIVVGIMLSMFYGQYRWLARGLVETSVVIHESSLTSSYEGRARAQLYRIADEIADRIDEEANNTAVADNSSRVSAIIDRAVRNNDNLAGLRYINSESVVIEAGNTTDLDDAVGATKWQNGRLYLSYPVFLNDVQIGKLASSFTTTGLRQESREFEERLLTLEAE